MPDSAPDPWQEMLRLQTHTLAMVLEHHRSTLEVLDDMREESRRFRERMDERLADIIVALRAHA